MNDHDEIEALWLNLERIMNALEELGEDPHMTTQGAGIYGKSAALRWDMVRRQWEVGAP